MGENGSATNVYAGGPPLMPAPPGCAEHALAGLVTATTGPQASAAPLEPAACLRLLRQLTFAGRFDWRIQVASALVEAGVAAQSQGHSGAGWSALPWYGPLEVFLSDSSISDILINGPGRDVVVVKDGVRMLTGMQLHQDWIEFAQRQLLLRSGCVSASDPAAWPGNVLIGTADGRLRFAVTRPPVTPQGPGLVVRVLPQRWPTLEDLIHTRVISASAGSYLRAALQLGLTLLIAGQSGSGKTTVAAALLQAIGDHKRVVMIEEAQELPLLADSVHLEVQRSGLDFSACVRFAMRQKPDLIVVGEVRGAEALAMLQAAATGHPGIGTIHAADPQTALKNLERMAVESGQSEPSAVRAYLASGAVPLVVLHVDQRLYGGRRRVGGIYEVKRSGAVGQIGDIFPLNRVFEYDLQTNELVCAIPSLYEPLRRLF